MADNHYFSAMGMIEYNGKQATNILARARIREDIIKHSELYTDYTVGYAERPDIVAHKFYGNSKLDWVVLYANTILDPYHQWPMTHEQLTEFMIDKYGSISEAAQTIKKYQWIVYPQFIEVNGTVHKEITIDIDAAMYATIAEVSRRKISAYDYEVTQNDLRREIKIIDPRYVAQIQSEFQSAFE